MFEIGFSEMVVIAVVALVVLGPERLPVVARTLGHLWGRANRYINGIKADMERDLHLAELRQMQQKVQQEADLTAQALRLSAHNAEQQVQQLNTDLVQGAEEALAPASVAVRAQPSKSIPAAFPSQKPSAASLD